MRARAVDLPEGPFHRDGDVELSFQWAPPPWAGELYGSVAWGTRGMLYRFLEPDAMVALDQDAGWITIAKAGEPIGLYMVTPRLRSWNGERVPCVYRSLLAISPSYKGKSLGNVLVTESKRFLEAHVPRGVLFGFIDHDNDSSLAAARRAGYEPVSELMMESFSRRSPQAVPGVRRLRPDEQQRFVESLETL